MRRLLAPVSLVVLLTAPVLAQTVPSPAKGGPSQQDRTFVNGAAAGGLAEVAVGKIAEEKAQKDVVKDFARQMVGDHGNINSQLTAIVRQENVKAPTSPDKAHVAAADRLKKLSGAEFDRAYMKQQVQDHEKTIQLFQKEANSGQDAKLKAFAADTLPTLQHHLQMAQGGAAK
jgi:putative membrane protein